jgi:hypothetical protein
MPRCMFVLQHSNPSAPVRLDERCPEAAVEQEESSGNWYCRQHLDQRRTDSVAARNGDGCTFAAD